MRPMMKPTTVREEKVSITVKDYNKFNRVLEQDKSIVPHLERLYKSGYDNVFKYGTELKVWLDANKIDYRVNWEKIL